VSAQEQRYECKTCGAPLDDPHAECPSCGRKDALVVGVPAVAHLTAPSPSLKLESVWEYVERDWRWLVVLVTFTVSACAVSTWVLTGWVSFVVDLGLAVVGGVIGVRATRSVIERETRHVT
jgi:hypothetical protein